MPSKTYTGGIDKWRGAAHHHERFAARRLQAAHIAQAGAPGLHKRVHDRNRAIVLGI